MLEEITVTAEKRESTVQATPIAIDVKDGVKLTQEGRTRIDDILHGTIGVMIRPQGRGMVLNIRGIESVEGEPPGSGIRGTSIPVMLDGVYQDRTESIRGGSLDLARVEVLRGPQSAMLGASTLIGAVNIITNDPIFEYQSSVNLEVGTYNLFNVGGVMNVPLTENTAFRFAASSNKRDGYYSSGAGESDLLNARAKYRWQPGDDLDVVVTANHQFIGGFSQASMGVLPEGRWVSYASNPDSDRTTAGYPPDFAVSYDGTNFRTRSDAWDDGYPKGLFANNPFMETTINGFSAKVDWELGIGTLTLTPNYQEYEYESNDAGLSSSGTNEHKWQDTIQFEAVLTSEESEIFEWVGGVYYYDAELESLNQSVNYPTTADGSTSYKWQSTPSSTHTTLSGFANATYTMPFNEKLSAFGGLRYSSDEKTLVTEVSGFKGVSGDNLGPYSAYEYTPRVGHTFSSTAYRGGLEYQLDKNIMLYAGAATGNKPGYVTYNSFLHEPGEYSITPNLELTQYTAGIKSRFLDNKLQVNVEAFSSKFENQQFEGAMAAALEGVSTADNCGFGNYPPGLAPTVVVGENGDCACITSGSAYSDMTSNGVDMEISFLLTVRDRINMSVEYLDSTYDTTPTLYNGDALSFTAESLYELIDSPTDEALANLEIVAEQLNAVVASVAGNPLRSAADWSVNAGYEHRFDLPGGSSLTPKINLVYKTEYWSGGDDILKVFSGEESLAWQDDYITYDFYTTWDSSDGKFTVTGYVKNISEEVIMTSYSTDTVMLDAPRTAGIILQARF